MRRHLKPPSASTAVALLALFVALGGTGYAAVKLSGKDIQARTVAGKKFKNRTVAGKKLKGNTLTGRQIRESRLATVPRADAATTAAAANALAAGAAAGFVRRGKVLDTDLVKLPAVGTSAGTSPLKTIFKSGPFTFQAACWNAAGGKTALRLRVTSTEGGIYNSNPLPLDDFQEEVSLDPDDFRLSLIAPSGATLMSSVYYGIKRLGADCLVAVDGVVSR